MELNNEFTIDRPIEDTWRILNDLEFIAPCMPGAQLKEIEGDEYRGLVKIKVGPITANYAGKARFVEQNAETKVARLKAEGRDPRQGNANAVITATMVPVTEGQTSVSIQTDLSLSGKIASFGRGAIEDVSRKLLNQFSDNLRDKLEVASDEDAEPDPAGDETTTATDDTPGAEATTTTGEADKTDAAGVDDGVRRIEAPEPEPVDILAVSADSVLKRLAPVFGAVALLIVLRILLKRRH